MAKSRRGRKNENDPRPIATDDFIYETPDETSSDSRESDAFNSETPEEAIRRLRGRRSSESSDSRESGEISEPPADAADEESASPKKRKVYSSGIMLDDNLQPIRKEKKRHPVLRGIALTLITVILLATAGSYILHRILPLRFPPDILLRYRSCVPENSCP